MTFPPCFSSFSARPSIGGATDRLDLLRHHQQQSRLFSTSIAPHSQLTFEPRSATPDLMVEDSTSDSSQDSSQDSSSESQENMEDNAARMLLALSNIVTKEISADSSCISRGGNKIKNETVHQDANKKVPHTPERDLSAIEQEAAASPPSMTVPKSIEIHNPDWGSCVATAASPTKPIPREVTATRSISYSSLASPLTPNSLPNSSSTNSFEGFPAATANTNQRYRTVSLAGDEMVPDDRELSPLLLPLTAPSFSMPNGTTKTPPRLSRKHQLNLNQLDQLNLNLEHEALRRALGAKVFSAALASAAIITPVPEKPRPIISFKTNGVVVDGNNHIHNTNKSGLIHEPTEDRSKRLLPMDLPPLLFHSNKSNQEANNNIKTPARVARSYSKRSSPARKATTKKQQQVAHGPRSKKKASPKKQARQRHTGKKFSWKAYPELEEFLITNREEYLSFSARNYTIEQRDYNNRLTSRLLEHAEANGYSTLFASCAFSAVRDRIRSYYKSYVQSFKRRRERQEQQDRLKKLEMGRH